MEDRPSLLTHFLRDGALGFVLGSLVGGVLFGLAELLTVDPRISGAFAIATGLSLMVVMLVGVVVTEWARRRMDADKPLSASGLSVAMMLLGTAVYLGFALGAGAVLVSAVGA